METVKTKIENLRKLLRKAGLAAYIIPNNDEFQNEYLPPSARRLEFLTGFTGSAGSAVIGLKKAAFFTDGRYILQASAQLDKKLFEVFNISEKKPERWIEENKLKTGFNPWLFSASQVKRFSSNLRLTAYDLIDKIWKDKPTHPVSKAKIFQLKFAGIKWQDKTKKLAAKLNTDMALIASPDSVNWLFNIRGADIPNTPFCLAYALLRKKGKPVLFIDSKKLSAEIKKHLSGVEIKNLSLAEIKKITRGKKVFLDPARTPFAIFSALQKICKITEGQDPCLLPKAIKNETEIAGIKRAHELDGNALGKFLKWVVQQDVMDEVTAQEKLEEFRRENPEYLEPSFDTISGFGANGAIVHYRATPQSCKTFTPDNLYLVDSGGQYEFGTTDVTRTIAIGKPSEEMRRNYTLVLKGHIALATAIFPRGTTGAQLDALARQFLWADGKDYDHGTGHGVGYYLSVHEGPQGISKRASDTALVPGMIISNEPGYYKTGEYGIRIENLVLVVEKLTPAPHPALDAGAPRKDPASSAGSAGYLGFETLTRAPLDEKLIMPELLTQQEKEWISSYHDKIS